MRELPPSVIDILPAVKLPPPSATGLSVLLNRQGRMQELVIQVRQPTLVEDIVVSTVPSRIEYLPRHELAIGSLRDYHKVPRKLARDLLCRMHPRMRSELCILDMRSKEPNNVAHLLLDIIPYYQYLDGLLPGQIVLLLRSIRPNFAAILEYFGVRVMFSRGAVEGKMIRVFGTRGLALYELKDIFDCAGINFFPAVYGESRPSSLDLPQRIFLARRDQRRLLNHTAVEAMLRERGYTTVFMEDHDIERQIAIGAAAKHVVAVHGAAMSYLVMAARVKSVVEISPPHVYHQLFPLALSTVVDKYAMTIQEFDDQVVHAGWASILKAKETPFAADLHLLASALQRVGG